MNGIIRIYEALTYILWHTLVCGMPDLSSAFRGSTHFRLKAKARQQALGPQVKVYAQANLMAESPSDDLTRRPAFPRASTGRGSGPHAIRKASCAKPPKSCAARLLSGRPGFVLTRHLRLGRAAETGRETDPASIAVQGLIQICFAGTMNSILMMIGAAINGLDFGQT